MRRTIQTIAMMMLATALLMGCATSARIETIQVSAEKRNSDKIHSPCIKKMDCSFWGECSYRKGLCFATSDADCRRSEVCQQYGRCVLKNGGCTL